MFLVVEKLIENYIAFAHMGEASYLPTVGQRFEEKIEGQVVKRYIAVSQKKKQGYYCIDIYNDTNDQPIATLTAGLKIEKKKNGYLISPKNDLKIVYKGDIIPVRFNLFRLIGPTGANVEILGL